MGPFRRHTRKEIQRREAHRQARVPELQRRLLLTENEAAVLWILIEGQNFGFGAIGYGPTRTQRSFLGRSLGGQKGPRSADCSRPCGYSPRRQVHAPALRNSLLQQRHLTPVARRTRFRRATHCLRRIPTDSARLPTSHPASATCHRDTPSA